MLTIENLSMVPKEIIGCYEKEPVAMSLICDQLVYMVTILKSASVPVWYRTKMKNLVMVATEVNNCFRKILVAMVNNVERSINSQTSTTGSKPNLSQKAGQTAQETSLANVN